MNNANLDKNIQKIKEADTFLQAKYDFRYNEVANRVEYRVKGPGTSYRVVNDADLWYECLQKGIKVSRDVIKSLLATSIFCPAYNPLKDWMRNLPTSGSGEDPFKDLASFIELENDGEQEFNRLYRALKNWFVSAVKTLFDSDYRSKHCLILQGPSGIGKTPFLESFLPGTMLEYMHINPSLDISNKDSKIALSRFLIIVLDEIDDYLKDSRNRRNFKSYTSMNVINIRPPYQPTEVYRTRVASLVGTCNQGTFLKDPTGSQRFIIFSVKRIISRQVNPSHNVQDHFDMPRCWTRAHRLYREGHNPEYSLEDLKLNESANERYKFNSPELEIVREHFRPATKGAEGATFMTPTQICACLNKKQKDFTLNPIQLGKALVRLNFNKLAKKIDGQVMYGYWIVDNTSSDSKLEKGLRTNRPRVRRYYPSTHEQY